MKPSPLTDLHADNLHISHSALLITMKFSIRIRCLAFLTLVLGLPNFTSCSQIPLPFRGGASASKDGPLQTFVNTIKNAKRDLAAAAVARCVSIFLMFPVDTVKTRIQMEQANPFPCEGVWDLHDNGHGRRQTAPSQKNATRIMLSADCE